MNSNDFRGLLYDELAQSFVEMPRIKKFTTNPAIIGAHAEEAVKQFVCRNVSPVRVSTGAVIHENLCINPSTVPQVDAILWSPNPSPAIFENGAFALVPKQCVFGILEIKRSCYSGAPEKLCKVVSQADKLASDGVVLLDHNEQELFPGFGVICVLEEEQRVTLELQRLIDSGRAAVLCRLNGGNAEPDRNGVIQFVNFLSTVRHWALRAAGTTRILPEFQGGGSTFGLPVARESWVDEDAASSGPVHFKQSSDFESE